MCSENSPYFFYGTVVLRTNIVWATAGTAGITVVNLRSRYTKLTQVQGVTQQEQHSTAETVKLQQ